MFTSELVTVPLSCSANYAAERDRANTDREPHGEHVSLATIRVIVPPIPTFEKPPTMSDHKHSTTQKILTIRCKWLTPHE